MASIFYQRKNGDQAPEKYSWDFINRNGDTSMQALEPLKGTVVAAGNALPQVSSVVQEFIPYSRTVTTNVVCAGTIQKIGDRYGVMMTDAPVGETASFATRGRFRALLASGASVTVGTDAYILASSMEVSHDSTGREYIGYFVEAAETNPDGGPAGTYAIVQLSQNEK